MYAKMLITALESDISVLEKMFGDKSKPQRVLADENEIGFEFTEDEDALSIGEDNNLDDSYLNDVKEVTQASNDEQLKAVDNLSEADSGSLGDDSSTDNMPDEDTDDSGSNTMMIVMIILGLSLVVALIAGYVFYMKAKKDGEESPLQQDTEMTP
jgi:hypothetical protein